MYAWSNFFRVSDRQWLQLKDSAILFWSVLRLPWVDWVQALPIIEMK